MQARNCSDWETPAECFSHPQKKEWQENREKRRLMCKGSQRATKRTKKLRSRRWTPVNWVKKHLWLRLLLREASKRGCAIEDIVVLLDEPGMTVEAVERNLSTRGPRPNLAAKKVEPLGAVFSAACQLCLMANRAYGWARCLLHDPRLNTLCGFWTESGEWGHLSLAGSRRAEVGVVARELANAQLQDGRAVYNLRGACGCGIDFLSMSRGLASPVAK
jgi:hypothetical protein